MVIYDEAILVIPHVEPVAFHAYISPVKLDVSILLPVSE